MFIDGEIDGLTVTPLELFDDERGWLTEIFREDEIDKKIMPAMSYVSLTKTGMSRGPHEHIDQTDYFAFVGPGDFLLMVWDNRKESPTYNHRKTLKVGETNKAVVIVPPCTVHAYANIGKTAGLVFNCPNRLFAGKDKQEKIDEVRHEDSSKSPYMSDFIKEIERVKS